MTESRLGYLPALDGLRAVAIVLVVSHHSLPSFIGGRGGVDVFFVLSGFLITTLIAGGIRSNAFSRRHFYARRGIRLVPALMATVGVATPVALIFTDERDVWWGAISAMFYLTPFGPITIFYHTWTLAIEEWFYLLWPLALAKMFLDQLTFRQVMVLVGSLGVAAQAGMIYDTDFFVFRVSGLLIGCAAALWWCDDGMVNRPRIFVSLGVFLIVGGAFAAPVMIPVLPFWMAIWGSTFVVLGIASRSNSLATRLLETRLLVAIGVVSYEWYLLHATMLNLAKGLWGPSSFWLVVPFSLLAGFGLHYALVPIQSRLRMRLDFRPARPNSPLAG